MNNFKAGNNYTIRHYLAVGLISGLVIAVVDNFTFDGEISPIVIVLLLMGTTAIFGMKWGWRGWPATALTWLCLPAAHLINFVFGLPDTLHPNTLFSIQKLAVFTFVIAVFGMGLAIYLCKLRDRKPGTGPSQRGR